MAVPRCTSASPTCRSTRDVPRAGPSTGWSVCRSRRSASAGSRRTATTRASSASRWTTSTGSRSTSSSTQLPDEPIATTGEHGFDIDDEAYADIVRRIIDDEIGNGEGANLVIARNYTATIADWDHAKALTVFRRLLERERGAYWTFVVFTGDRFLIGASPERHVSVQGGEVRMNPISGTFRVGRIGDPSERKARLLEFLADEKEIYELFMVVDEELKMMCDICSEGGQILGPYLKPMTHLIHTEYILAGRTHRDVRDVLRSSMYAATVTGSPVENACRVIAEYEQQGRGYYGAVMALIGRDDEGESHGRRTDHPAHGRRQSGRARSASPPGPRWSGTPSRRTRSRRRTPRQAGSSRHSDWCRRRPRPAVRSPTWRATRTCWSPWASATSG